MLNVVTDEETSDAEGVGVLRNSGIEVPIVPSLSFPIAGHRPHLRRLGLQFPAGLVQIGKFAFSREVFVHRK